MNLAPEIMKEVLEIVEVLYALRNELKLKSKKTHFVKYGIETASFVIARICQKSKLGFLKTGLASLPIQCIFL